MEHSRIHWNHIYRSKSRHEVSWTQEIPATSLDFIHSFRLPKTASIIDVGGGESRFVDFLLKEGYTDITLLDISEEALTKTKARLGNAAAKIKWIVSDVTQFVATERYDVWHDRATFHFLTTPPEIEKYVARAAASVKDNGYLAIGTFSESGPEKCSGLPVRRYSEKHLEQTLTYYFSKIRCITEDHLTPFKTIQNFLFCSFKRAA